MSARPGQPQASHRPPRQPDIGWQDNALCAETSPTFFYPDGAGASVAEARKICARCEVTNQCLQYALDNAEEFGVWGGKSPKQRRRITKAGAA